MEHSEPLSIMASDGRRLAVDLFRTHGPVRAQVIVHGATAVPRGYYAPFARFLASAGFETLTYDYRGVGGSVAGRARDDAATMSDWLTLDAPAAVRALRGVNPRVPFLAVGHSFGGQIVAALADVEAPEAIVTLGAQRGYWGGFSPAERAGIAAKLFVMLPLLTSTLGYLPKQAGLGVDMPAGIVDEWARWCRSSDYFLGDHPELRDRLARYSGSLLALSVDDDSFAPLGNVTWLYDLHEAAEREHAHFRPADAGVRSFGHFGFFRSQHADTVWPEIVGHFDEALGAGSRPRQLGRAPGAPRRRVLVSERELMRDLDYGRA